MKKEKRDGWKASWVDKISLQAKIVIANITGSVYMLGMVLVVIYFMGSPALDGSVLIALYRNLIPVFVLSGLGGILAGYLVVRKLIREPLTRVVSVTERVAIGDLSGTVRLGSKDELGHLAEAFNAMTMHLSHLIGTAKEAATAISSRNIRLKENFIVMETAIKKVRTELAILAEAVEKQDIGIDVLTEKLHEISGLPSSSDEQVSRVEACLAVLTGVKGQQAHLEGVRRRLSDLMTEEQYVIQELLPEVKKLGHKVANLETLVDQFTLKEFARPQGTMPAGSGGRTQPLQEGA